jgi:hypothetical protein
MIRVCLVDDQTLARQGVHSLLDLADGIEVVAEAADGEEALVVTAGLLQRLAGQPLGFDRLDRPDPLTRARWRSCSGDHGLRDPRPARADPAAA